MHSALVAGMLGLACLSACSKSGNSSRPAPSAGVNANSKANTSGSAAPSASARATVPHLVQVKAECRALAVAGKATTEGVPIRVGDLLDGEHWVVLEAGSSVALRDTLTSRELKLIGPGLELPCRHGAEQVLIAQGRLSTSTTLGVRPGAEVLIATPAGTVRYGDAAIELEFGPKGLHVRVKEGDAWLEPENLGQPPFKNPLHNPSQASLPPSKATASELVEACNAAADTAAESARRVLAAGTPQAPASLGARAAAHVRNRSAARAACSIAAAAAGSVTDPAARQSLWDSITHADEVWQSVPRGVSAQKN